MLVPLTLLSKGLIKSWTPLFETCLALLNIVFIHCVDFEQKLLMRTGFDLLFEMLS